MITTKPAVASGHHTYSSSYQLPYELERQICEIAADNFPKCIPNLILAARRFKIWIEPELYRIMFSGGETCLPPLYVAQPGRSHSPPGVLDKIRIKEFGHHVQHVLLCLTGPEEIAEILECCPNVFNLGLWLIDGEEGPWAPVRSVLETLPLRKLSIDPSALFSDCSLEDGIPFNGPIFLYLTHLEIINSTSSWSRWKQVALLPKLTHLALYLGSIDQDFIDSALEECRSLELLVLLTPDIDMLDNLESPQKDDRVVYWESIGYSLRECEEWQKGARGEEDYWIKAQNIKEEMIRARQGNNVAPHVGYLDSVGQA